MRISKVLEDQVLASSESCSSARLFVHTTSPACISQVYVYLTTSCKQHCSYCWQSHDSTLLSLDALAQRLQQLQIAPKKIILLGGDLTCLPIEYLRDAYQLCGNFVDNVDDVSFVSSLLTASSSLLQLFTEVGHLKTSLEIGRYSPTELQKFCELSTELADECHITALSAVSEKVLQHPVEQTLDLLYTQIPLYRVILFPIINALSTNYYHEAESFLSTLYIKLPVAVRLITSSLAMMSLPGSLAIKAGLLKCPDRFFLSIAPDATLHSGVYFSGYLDKQLMISDLDLTDELFQHELKRVYCQTQLYNKPCVNCDFFQYCSSVASFPGVLLFSNIDPSYCHGLQNLRRQCLNILSMEEEQGTLN